MPYRRTRAAQARVALFVSLGLSGSQPGVAVTPGDVTLDEARRLHGAGQLEEAAQAYRDVLGRGEMAVSSEAVARNNLCVILDRFGDYREAERECREALRLRRTLDEETRLARSLNNLALTLQHLGSYEEAEESLFEALAINRNSEDLAAQAINLGNLGAVATLAGRYEDALDFHSSVAELASLHPDEWWAGKQGQTAQLNRGVVLERLGAYREALDLYQGLLEKGHELSSDQQASLWMNTGVVYRNLGDPVRAIADFESAAELYGEMGDLSGAAHASLNIGIARHLNLEDFEGAETSYRKVLEVVAASGDRLVEGDTLAFLGWLLLADGRRDEARGAFVRCSHLAEESNAPEGVWSSHTGLGEVELEAGNLEAALIHFETAIAAIEGGRTETPVGSYRESFFADKRRAYSGAVLTLAEMDRLDTGRGHAGRALEIAQRAKARDLLEALGTKDLGVSPLGSAEISRRIRSDVLLEYFIAGEEVLVWRVDGDRVEMTQAGAAGPSLEAVSALHRELSEGRVPPIQQLEMLATVLLGDAPPLPVGDAVLWIAPDLGLSYLPFELLPLEKSGALLLEKATVVYLPSAWALPESGRRVATGPLGFLGFGGVSPAERHSRSYLTSGLTLEPLPRSLQELREVSKRFKGEKLVLTGEAATERAFREAGGRGAVVTHFATHTAIGGPRGRGAAVLLSPENDDDGLLYPQEILANEMASSLVVLAACSSALGASEEGHALTSLTGSFLAAGAESVLATLWNVGDQPTAIFMQRFYDLLSRGSTPAEALRGVKLAFLADERWEAPHLWSGYVLVGPAPPLRGVFRARAWKWVLTLAVLLLLLAWRSGLARARGRKDPGRSV